MTEDLKNELEMKESDKVDIVDIARKAFRTTCAEWSSRSDHEVFNGNRGTCSFLRLCPLLNLSLAEFEKTWGTILEDVDWQKTTRKSPTV